MKTQIIIIFLALLSFSSCKKDDEKTCNLNASNVAPIDMTISFSASNTGDGVISSLTYKTSEKEETILNPTLPWTLEIDAAAATDISISAIGKVKNGSIKVSYYANSLGNEISGEDDCFQSNN